MKKPEKIELGEKSIEQVSAGVDIYWGVIDSGVASTAFGWVGPSSIGFTNTHRGTSLDEETRFFLQTDATTQTHIY